jgi:plasmid stabilization system protein ParE
MRPVVFAPAALRDLERLSAFLRTRNPAAANRAGAAIIKGVRALGTWPKMGRVVDDLPDIYRDWLIDFGDTGYVARYRITDDRVIILAVRHQKEAGW